MALVAHHSPTQALKEFCKALSTFDLNTLTKHTSITKDSYYTTCSCGFPEEVSLISFISSGGGTLEAFDWLLTTDILTLEEWVSILADLFTVSGCYIGTCDGETFDIRIWTLWDHLKTTPEGRKAMVDFRDKDYATTLLHQVYYGHTNDETMFFWGDFLISIGLDPFIPSTEGQLAFHLFCETLDVKKVVAFQDRFSADPLSSVYRPHYKYRTFLMHLLYAFRHEKRPETIDKFKVIFGILMAKDPDISVVDADGRNLADYFVTYKWEGVLNPLSLEPTGKPRKTNHIFSHIHSHPVIQWLYRHRYCHAFGSWFVAEFSSYLKKYGPPPMRERQITLEDGRQVKVETLSSLLHSWGYRHSSLKEMIDFK